MINPLAHRAQSSRSATAVVITYLANAPIGFGLEMGTSTIIGLTATTAITVAFLMKFRQPLVSSTSEG